MPLTADGVRRWHADLVSRGPGLSTAAKCYRLLRAILNTAVEDHHLVANPCTIRGAGTESAPERPVPTIGQVYELADAIAPRYRALVLLAALGGLRRGELLALTRQDVDLLHRTVTIRVQRQEGRSGEMVIGPPKTAAGRRTISLAPSVVTCLQEHRKQQLEHRMRLGQGRQADAALVFPGDEDQPWKPDLLTNAFGRAMASIGLPHRLHSLRHTHASALIASGMDILTISRRLGHTSAALTLGVYGHLISSKDGAAAAIEAVLKLPT